MISKKEFNSLIANYDGTFCHEPDDDDLPIAMPIRDNLVIRGLLFVNKDGKHQCTKLGIQSIDEYLKGSDQ